MSSSSLGRQRTAGQRRQRPAFREESTALWTGTLWHPKSVRVLLMLLFFLFQCTRSQAPRMRLVRDVAASLYLRKGLLWKTHGRDVYSTWHHSLPGTTQPTSCHSLPHSSPLSLLPLGNTFQNIHTSVLFGPKAPLFLFLFLALLLKVSNWKQNYCKGQKVERGQYPYPTAQLDSL